MKSFAWALVFWLVASAAVAATPAQEKQFVDTYKKAVESKDVKTLQSLLYTKGADERLFPVYLMAMTLEMGGKITSIRLRNLTKADKTLIKHAKDPNGKPVKFVLPATKRLDIESQTKLGDTTVSGSGFYFVGEQDGCLYVLLPSAAAK